MTRDPRTEQQKATSQGMKLWWKRRKAGEASRDPRTAAELQIHCAIVELLRVKALPKLIFHHPANGELRDKATAAKLKRMGVVAGVADLAFTLPDGRSAYMEIKRSAREVPSLDQQAFAARCQEIGVPYVVVWTLDQAQEVLWDWGALKGPAPVRRAA